MVLSAVGGGCDWISTTLQHLNSPRRAYRLSDRKSTRLNSSHLGISYAVFCLKKKIAELSVSDRGPGIPEDKMKEVFEPFFTSKAEGMGMGLSIARTIIEAHNGTVWAKNRDHGGASFRITLPLSSYGAFFL